MCLIRPALQLGVWAPETCLSGLLSPLRDTCESLISGSTSRSTSRSFMWKASCTQSLILIFNLVSVCSLQYKHSRVNLSETLQNCCSSEMWTELDEHIHRSHSLRTSMFYCWCWRKYINICSFSLSHLTKAHYSSTPSAVTWWPSDAVHRYVR